jgi:DNA-binding CsgD family transcriptional regulator
VAAVLETAIEIAEEAGVGLLITGKEGLSRYANPAFLELLDLPLERVLDRSPVDYVSEAARAPFEARLRRGGDPFELQGIGRSGRRVHAVVRSTPVSGYDGYLQGVIHFTTGTDPCARHAGAEAEARLHGALQRLGLAEGPAAPIPLGGVWSALSPREREVASLLMQGKRPSEIASGLQLSIHTVRNHLRLVYRKLGVHSQIELLARLRDPGESARI